MKVGAGDEKTVGTLVCTDGADEKAIAVGIAVVDVLGTLEVCMEGTSVGADDGALVGKVDGLLERLGEGCKEGARLGEFVTSEGDVVLGKLEGGGTIHIWS